MEEGNEEHKKERGHWGQPPSYTSSHRVRSKEIYEDIDKGKSPDAKGGQDNLRKAG